MKTNKKGIVLDANILIRAVLGGRVLRILQRFEEAAFYTPDVCLSDARKYLPGICEKRKLDTRSFLKVLDDAEKIVIVVDLGAYADREQEARSRIQLRDPDDWPVVAAALSLGLPVWTEDHDFFGSGVATWTTNTVEIYLRGRK